MTDALAKAIENSGGPAALARAIGGLTSQAVSQWKKCPADRVLDVERLTGVSRHDLRPDIFGPAPAATGEAA
jgi:DNA-binding transcriptional regulator YdaS (Cro superfamily)